MRTHGSWGLVLFRHLVSVAVVRLTGLVAGARPMAEPCLVLLGAMAGLAQDTAAQADSRTIEVQVNLPYALQFGLGSYDVGGLAVNVWKRNKSSDQVNVMRFRLR